MPEWIKVSNRLPDPGVDVILYFRDAFHKDPSWPKTAVMPAWRCNLGEKESHDGMWAIGGRLGKCYRTIRLEDGIAWMPMPEPPEKC